MTDIILTVTLPEDADPAQAMDNMMKYVAACWPADAEAGRPGAQCAVSEGDDDLLHDIGGALRNFKAWSETSALVPPATLLTELFDVLARYDALYPAEEQGDG